MSDIMRPIPFAQLMDWILTENAEKGSIFGIRKIVRHEGGAEPIFAEKIETPYGPAAGALLGGVFGLISFWECFGKSSFGVVLLGINPIYTFLVCVPTRILAGWLCGLAFKALSKVDKSRLWSFGAAGLCGALCNTVFFMTTLCLCFYHTEFIQNIVQALGSANPFLFVIAFVGVNGLIEAIVCFFTGAVIAKAVVFSRGKLAARRTAVQNGK